MSGMNSVEKKLTFRVLNESEIDVLHREHMTRDFPPSELKTAQMLIELAQCGINEVIACFSDDRLVGYYVLTQERESSLILLDYLAVEPEERGKAFGSMILQHIRETLPHGQYLFLEIENPDAAETDAERQERLRRIRFYHKNGAKESKLKVLLFGVDFSVRILSNDVQPSLETQERDYVSLYQQIFTKEVCAKELFTVIPAETNETSMTGTSPVGKRE